MTCEWLREYIVCRLEQAVPHLPDNLVGRHEYDWLLAEYTLSSRATSMV